jgi:hypothetical protein
LGTVLDTVVISRPTVTGDSSGLQAYRGWGQLDLDSRLTVQADRDWGQLARIAQGSRAAGQHPAVEQQGSRAAD